MKPIFTPPISGLSFAGPRAAARKHRPIAASPPGLPRQKAAAGKNHVAESLAHPAPIKKRASHHPPGNLRGMDALSK